VLLANVTVPTVTWAGSICVVDPAGWVRVRPVVAPLLLLLKLPVPVLTVRYVSLSPALTDAGLGAGSEHVVLPEVMVHVDNEVVPFSKSVIANEALPPPPATGWVNENVGLLRVPPAGTV